MSEKNKALVRRYFNEVLKKGNYDIIKELFSPSFIFSGPSLKKPILGMPDGVYEFVSSARHAFPDMFVSIENEIAEDDQVVVVWRITGTHKRPFRGMPPSGKYVSMTGMDIFYIEGDRIEGMWAFFDMKSALEQLLSKEHIAVKKTKRSAKKAANRKTKKISRKKK